jgi:hypothetical protein
MEFPARVLTRIPNSPEMTMTHPIPAPAERSLRPTKPTEPVAERDTRARPIGRTLDPAQLKQVGGGAETPVRRW